jgi:N utilization substance protein B
MPNPIRRLARIAALQTLYELDATSHPVTEVLARSLKEPFSESADAEAGRGESLDAAAQLFAAELVQGVLRHRDELDAIIVRSAPNWPIDQMGRVDKTILRLAIFEVLFHNRVPLKAAINEAVELGKRFGSDSSSRFINGVLGTVAQQVAAGGGVRAKVDEPKEDGSEEAIPVDSETSDTGPAADQEQE